jgi:3-hydroxyisobutyrate dehydrogenase
MSQFRISSPEQTRVAWVGAGVMGRSMCGHLLRAGYSVRLHTRTREKAEVLLAAGAVWTESAAEAATGADVIFLMVGFPEEAEAAGREVIAASTAGAIVVDMSTSPPSLAERLAKEASARGVGFLDAPVSGGDVGAREARLSMMVGGAQEALEAIRPLLECLGKTIVHEGAAGAGQHTKMVNQILIASTMVGVCEALLYAHRAGLNAEEVLRAVSGGAAASWSLSNLAPRMLRRDFAPGFFVEHFLKDMRIALDEARRMKLSLPGLALAQQLYQAVEAQGHGRRGTHALLLALETISGVAHS